MAIRFRQVTCAPLEAFEAAAPDGALIGIVGEDGAGKSRLLEVAAGIARPAAGSVEAPALRRLLGPDDVLDFAPVDLLLLDDALARHDLFARGQAAAALEGLRRAGATILMVAHDEELLGRLADEIWWLDQGRMAARGDPAEVLNAWRGHVARRLREWGETTAPKLAPRVRRGDGRAEVERVETIGENGRATMVWRSGELAVVRVAVRFREAVLEPVIGIMIRTRVGLNVYGTNTELEGVKLGPRAKGERLTLSFAFRCELCPGEYTLTVASHDPDGVWHDWLEDAVAFTVTDSRYTAGVANLRATVRIEQG
jgi:lipopolysaccharide transport system ATP-binding protein